VCLYGLSRAALDSLAAPPRASMPAKAADREQITRQLLDVLGKSGHVNPVTAAPRKTADLPGSLVESYRRVSAKAQRPDAASIQRALPVNASGIYLPDRINDSVLGPEIVNCPLANGDRGVIVDDNVASR
jgi:hypothetical protein